MCIGKELLKIHFIHLGIICFIFYKMLHDFLFSCLNNTFCINHAVKFKYTHWLAEDSLKYFTILRKIIVQYYVSSFFFLNYLSVEPADCLCHFATPIGPTPFVILISFVHATSTYLMWKKKIVIYKTKDKPKLNLVTRSNRFVHLIFGTEIKIDRYKNYSH